MEPLASSLLAGRTFGTAGLSKGGHVWLLEVEPHVAVRLKRCFPKLHQQRARVLELAATDENSRDLLWFCDRYPLAVREMAELQTRAAAFDARVERVLRILGGDFRALSTAIMAKPPREYQAQAAALAVQTGRLLCADDVGLGKTIVGLAMLASPQCRPAAVFTLTHLPIQWLKRCEEFLPTIRAHVVRKGTPYDVTTRGLAPEVLILPYSKMAGWVNDIAGWARAVIYDEIQELRHAGTLKHNAALMISEEASIKLGLSATPIYNYGEEFFNVYSVLDKDALGSQEEFTREWCAGRVIQNPRAFGTYLREQGLMVRRTRKDVGRELPPCQTIIHEIECDVDLLKGQDQAMELARVILSTAKPFEKMQAAGQFEQRMRQETGVAKAPFVAHFVEMLLEQNEGPVLLYGWHHAVYDIWKKKLGKYKPVLYTGEQTPAQKERAKDDFVSGRSRLMIMSLRAGAGVDGLQQVCSQLVIGELDWSEGVIVQDIGRLYRDGQPDPVFAYIPVVAEGSDPVMMDVLGLKKFQLAGVIDPTAESAELRSVDPDHIKKLAADFLRRVSLAQAEKEVRR